MEEFVESPNQDKYDKEPKLYKTPKEVVLPLRNGEKLEVKELGIDYYGRYGGRELWCPIYSYEAIKWLADEMKYAVAHMWDQVSAHGGREGSGKSDITLHLLDHVTPDYPLEKITFTQRDFRDAVFNAKFYDTVVMDEGGEAMLAQEWYEKAQRDLVKAFLRFRIKKLKVFINLPHIMLLNKQLRERRVYWWLEVYAKDWDKRGYVQVRRAPIKQDPFKTDIFWKGVFTIRFPAYKTINPKRWAEYEKIKMEKLEEAEQLPAQKESTSFARQTNVRTVKNLQKRGLNVSEIAEITGLSERTIYSYLQKRG